MDGFKEIVTNTGSWFPVHRVVLEQLQCANTAMYLFYLIDQRDYWTGKGKLVEGSWFFLTLDEASKKLGIKKHSLRKAKERLKELGLVEFKQMLCKKKKEGRREHIKINMGKVVTLMKGHVNLSSGPVDDLPPLQNDNYEASPSPNNENIDESDVETAIKAALEA